MNEKSLIKYAMATFYEAQQVGEINYDVILPFAVAAPS